MASTSAYTSKMNAMIAMNQKKYASVPWTLDNTGDHHSSSIGRSPAGRLRRIFRAQPMSSDVTALAAQFAPFVPS
jgi:hypothetical protein